MRSLVLATLVLFTGCVAAPDDPTVEVRVTLPDGSTRAHDGTWSSLVRPLIAAARQPLIVDGLVRDDPAALLATERLATAYLVPGSGWVTFVPIEGGLEVRNTAGGEPIRLAVDHDGRTLTLATVAGTYQIDVDGELDEGARRTVLGAVALTTTTGGSVEAMPELSPAQLGIWQCIRRVVKIGGAPVGVALEVVLGVYEYTSAVECRRLGSADCYTGCAAAARQMGVPLLGASAVCDGGSSTCTCRYGRPRNQLLGETATCSTTQSDPFPCATEDDPEAMCVEESSCCSAPDQLPTPEDPAAGL